MELELYPLPNRFLEEEKVLELNSHIFNFSTHKIAAKMQIKSFLKYCT